MISFKHGKDVTYRKLLLVYIVMLKLVYMYRFTNEVTAKCIQEGVSWLEPHQWRCILSLRQTRYIWLSTGSTEETSPQD